jgi:2-oxoglutarate/2-oxoacid ferredoxin oxidoreductase subunit alpha
MTATSGPGFCLMIETLQYAVMTETPFVVALVQRLGPSTGGATQGGQGDVLLAEHFTSGGYTIPVFAPSTAAECHRLTQVAFAWSERLRTPVVLLSDKETGMTLESVDTSALERVEVPARRMFEGDPARFVPYRRACPDEAPEFAPVGGDAKVVATGSAHDAAGRLRKNAPEVLELAAGLEAKIARHAGAMALTDSDIQAGADTVVVSFGVSARAAREAVDRLRAGGRRVSNLKLWTLFPVPEAALEHAARDARTVVVVEENLGGLYASAIDSKLGGRRVVRVNAIGRMIAPSEIVAAVEAS